MSRCGCARAAGCLRTGSGPATTAVSWVAVVRYDPTEGVYGWAATCPYCGAVGDYSTLSDAVRAGIKHTKVCHETP